MKHYIYLLLVMILFAACGCHRRIESSETLVTKDSVNIRDSIIFKDSVMIRYEYNLIDSVKIRDSMVLVLDSQGNILSKERYRTTDRNRDSKKNEAVSKKELEGKYEMADGRHVVETTSNKEEVKEPPNYKFVACIFAGIFIAVILFAIWLIDDVKKK